MKKFLSIKNIISFAFFIAFIFLIELLDIPFRYQILIVILLGAAEGIFVTITERRKVKKKADEELREKDNEFKES